MVKRTVRVLVTAAGAAHALNVITSLRRQDELPVHIVAADASQLAAGLYLADEYCQLPPTTSAGYLSSLIGALERFRIECLLPMHSTEIAALSPQISALETIGVKTYLPPPGAVSILNDKWQTYLLFRSIGVCTPRTLLVGPKTPPDCLPLPYMIKGRTGSGGRSVIEVSDSELAAYYLRRSHGQIAQAKVEGQEITIDFLADSKQVLICAVARERRRISDGKSVVGATVPLEPMRNALQRIVTTLRYRGVGNLQVFRQGESYLYTELNPRFAAGGLPLSIQAGHHLPLQLLKLALGAEVAPCPPPREGMVMIRYLTEVFPPCQA